MFLGLPGSKIASSMEFLEPDGPVGGWFLLGIEPPCLSSRVILGSPQVEIFRIWMLKATEIAHLIGQWAPDGENSPQRPVGFDPQETFA
jgi:hypothetical protein